MKCRFTHGKISTVISTNRRGVVILGAVLQDLPDINLFALCTEDSSDNRFWTTLWYRKADRIVGYSRPLVGLPLMVVQDIRSLRDDILSGNVSARQLSDIPLTVL
jgi:hypothetical protein